MLVSGEGGGGSVEGDDAPALAPPRTASTRSSRRSSSCSWVHTRCSCCARSSSLKAKPAAANAAVEVLENEGLALEREGDSVDRRCRGPDPSAGRTRTGPGGGLWARAAGPEGGETDVPPPSSDEDRVEAEGTR